jgi:hypothetical protein
MPEAPSRYINVQAAAARYDEIYSDADISFSTEGECDTATFAPEADKRVCVGFNTDCATGASASLPIFKNQYVDIECTDCFIDFTMDVFFEIKIVGFTVQNISLGFRDIAVNGTVLSPDLPSSRTDRLPRPAVSNCFTCARHWHGH